MLNKLELPILQGAEIALPGTVPLIKDVSSHNKFSNAVQSNMLKTEVKEMGTGMVGHLTKLESSYIALDNYFLDHSQHHLHSPK